MIGQPKALYKRPGRHATWLELFFDLVFVAVIGVVSHDLAHTHHGHITLTQLARFPLVFIPIWWIWMTHTLYANRFDRDDRKHRLVALLIMALVVVLSGYADGSLDGEFAKFAGIYVLVRLILALLYLEQWRQGGDEMLCARPAAISIMVGAIICGAAIFLPAPQKFAVFYTGIAIDITWQAILRARARQHPVDRSHLIERIGLLVIIILGESVIAIVASLAEVDWTTVRLAGAVAGFVMIWSIWWIYFDGFTLLERARRLTSGNTLIFCHLVFCMGLLILANMIQHSIVDDLDRETFSRLAVAGVLAFYLGKQVPYWQVFPPWRGRILFNSLACIAVTIASTFLPSIQLSLIGMTAGVLLYTYLSFRTIERLPVDAYVSDHD